MSASFYPNCTPSRAARRRIAKVQAAVEKVTAADAAFFRRRPDREFRVRLAAACEIESASAVLDEDQIAVPGARHVMLVRRLGPNVRFRVLAQSWAWKANDLDNVDDEEAGRAYRHTCRPGTVAHRVEVEAIATLRAAGLVS